MIIFPGFDGAISKAFDTRIPSGTALSGLVLYLDAGNYTSYPNTPNTSSNWRDLSSSSMNAILNGGFKYTTLQSGALIFNSTSATFASVAVASINTASAKINNLASSTFSFWVELSPKFINADANLLWKTGGSFNSGWYICSTAAGGGSIRGIGLGVVSSVVDTFNGMQTASFTASIGSINNIAFTWNGITGSPSNIGMFFNGLPFTGSSIIGTGQGNRGTDATFELNIGKAGNVGISNAAFSGSIAQISIYNRVLTNAEISANFQTLRGRYNL